MAAETHDSYCYVYIGIQIQFLFTETSILETVLTGLRPNQETTKQFSRYQSLIHLLRISNASQCRYSCSPLPAM